MNLINVIQPYRYLDMWVFDDPRVGLSAEPFVGGADIMIDRVTSLISDAHSGFTMVFSRLPFPGHQFRLEWRREEAGGNVYYSDQLDAEGWLCPALLRYFDERPLDIYVQIKPKAPDLPGTDKDPVARDRAALSPWEIVAILVMVVIAVVLALPDLRRSYTGAVLSGKCEGKTMPPECRPPPIRRAAAGLSSLGR